MKKLLGFTIMILFISVIIIPSTSTSEEIESIIIKRIDTSPYYLDAKISRTVSSVKSSTKTLSKDGIIIYDTEYSDYHPTLAGDKSDRFFACFEVTIDEYEYYPDFWYSLGGVEWNEAGYFAESGGAEYPDVDANENGFYGTFSGNGYNGGEQWLIIGEDLSNIGGYILDWSSYGFDDFQHMSISCYTKEDELSNYGGMACTGYNGYSGNDWDGNPFIFYPVGEFSGTIDWLDGLEGYFHSDIAIDEITEMSYAIYDHTIDANLVVRKDDFGTWDTGGHHPYIDSWFVGDNVSNLRNPSIEANDDTVIIVCEEEDDIVCFYSYDGFQTVQKSTVVDSAQFPEVKVTFNGWAFFCTYVIDNSIYRKMSNDGGATWIDKTKVVGDFVPGHFGCHDLGKGQYHVFSVWEDMRSGEDTDIYFGGEPPHPAHLEITIQTGLHFGVLADIFNGGCGGGGEVEWSINLDKGIILLGRYSSGIIELIPMDDYVTVRTKGVFGIGNISISVTAVPSYGDGDNKKANGFVFGPFVYIKDS